MSGTIGVVIARDLFRKYFDSSRWSRQRIAFGIHPELFEENVRRRRVWNFEVSAPPELVEAGPLRHVWIRALARRLVNVTQPLNSSASFRERVASSEPLRQIAKDCKVVARLADRSDRLLHRDDESIPRTRTDIVALERRGGWQHDIGVARSCGPPWIVDDDRRRAPPRAKQAVEILMVVKRIAAAPVDEIDIGINEVLPVVLEALPRVEQ